MHKDERDKFLESVDLQKHLDEKDFVLRQELKI